MLNDQNQWMPIETSPKDGSAILVWSRGEAYVAKWRPGYEEWGVCVQPLDESASRTFVRIGPYVWEGRELAAGPSHWMPLPPAPKSPEIET